MHNPESVLENETHKLLWDFEIQTDHLISTRRPDLVILKKKKEIENLPKRGLCRPGRLQRTNKKLYNMKVTVIPVVTGVVGTNAMRLVKGLEELETRDK